MINTIKIGNLRNAEYLQFMKNVASLVEANDPNALNVASQHNALVAKTIEIEAFFKTETSNPITQELVLLDERRDQCINGILFVVNGYAYHYIENIKQAATLLQDNLKLYGGGIATQSYQAETATLNNIIADWQNKPKLTEAMQTLDLQGWVQEMKDINTLFDKKYLERTQEYGAASPSNLKIKREETNGMYYDLRKFIEAYSIINSNAPVFTKTINEINALIEQYNTLLAGRRSNNSNKNEKPDTPETNTNEEV